MSTDPSRLALLGVFIVMSHLQASSFESTLDVEPLICLRAVEDTLNRDQNYLSHVWMRITGIIYLVAAHLLRHVVQSLDHLQTQLLPLLVFGHRNILNMPDKT